MSLSEKCSTGLAEAAVCGAIGEQVGRVTVSVVCAISGSGFGPPGTFLGKLIGAEAGAYVGKTIGAGVGLLKVLIKN